MKDSNRIVKINITAEVQNEDLITEFESKNFLIKDEINKIIRSKTEEEIEGSQGQLKLQNDITARLKSLFNNNDIVNVYFSELIVQ